MTKARNDLQCRFCAATKPTQRGCKIHEHYCLKDLKTNLGLALKCRCGFMCRNYSALSEHLQQSLHPICGKENKDQGLAGAGIASVEENEIEWDDMVGHHHYETEEEIGAGCEPLFPHPPPFDVNGPHFEYFCHAGQEEPAEEVDEGEYPTMSALDRAEIYFAALANHW